MISINEVQSGIVARAKARAEIVALLTTANEIREDEWQGDEFVYPNIRVSVDTMIPMADCNKWTVPADFLCFSEKASSREANSIASEVVDQFHNKSFTQGTIRYLFYCTGLVPAVRVDERTWKASAQFRVIVEAAT